MSVIASDTTAASASPGHTAYHALSVVLTDTLSDAVALNVAADLAVRHRAHLDVVQPLVLPTPMIHALSLAPDWSFQQIQSELRAEATATGNAICKRLSARGVSSVVRAVEAPQLNPEALAAAAVECADLVLVARPDATERVISFDHELFAALLLESGRPVLVVPAGVVAPFQPRRAVIAWSDTRECARAMHDALPLLAECDRINVLNVVPASSEIDHSGLAAKDIVRHLARHGLAARSCTVRAREQSTAEAILRYADRTHADLIVAGGYGHGRRRERMFGGTTRALFLDSRVPVLFSH
jgi:nucleotide-binding universal stress UspA family protein